ncbi:hypothetical protein RHODGE_RHODGE_03310 [Rhodoplanes serenus]|uniref:Uncharacterized protein n=1 Tax=Rhodoplanes serenus TaxID=200615 RepID=A0A447CY10_9BRAD|nr:hypothetical protein [Rhodoplanes serenus]VCU10124.1 hypothetical protein RHODGE_RHODGE_03310 [Rhodoplanes serenus]
MADLSRLYDLARQVRRLDPPDRSRPHRFAEDKSELAAELRAIARAAGARPALPVGGQPTVIRVRGRSVLVQRRRPGFGLG